MPDTSDTLPAQHNLHSEFFKDIYSNPRYAQDLLHLALSGNTQFDLDQLIPGKNANIDPNTGAEGSCDLNFSVRIKDHPDCQEDFGAIFKHATGNAPEAVGQLHRYSRHEMGYHDRIVTAILVMQTKRPVEIDESGIDPKLASMLPAGVIDRLRPLVIKFPIKSVNFPKLSDEQLQGADIITSPCLLSMKHIWNLNTEVVAKILRACHSLPSGDRKNLSAKLISYLGRADGRYDRKTLFAIEADCFPNLAPEERLLAKIEFGFDEARLEGLEQGRKQGIEQGLDRGREQEREDVIVSMLKHGELKDSAICQITNITKEQLAEIKARAIRH